MPFHLSICSSTPCVTPTVKTYLEFTILIILFNLAIERLSLPTTFFDINKSDALVSTRALLQLAMLMSKTSTLFYLRSLLILAKLSIIYLSFNILPSLDSTFFSLLVATHLDYCGQSCILCEPHHKQHFTSLCSFPLTLLASTPLTIEPNFIGAFSDLSSLLMIVNTDYFRRSLTIYRPSHKKHCISLFFPSSC